MQDVPVPDIHSRSIMRADKLSISNRGIVAMNGDDQRHLQPACHGKNREPRWSAVSMNQDGLMLPHTPKEERCASEYLERDLLEPVPELRGPGIIAQHDGPIGGNLQARRGPLGADVQGGKLGKRGSLCADKGHARRQQWLSKDGHDWLRLKLAHCPSRR